MEVFCVSSVFTLSPDDIHDHTALSGCMPAPLTDVGHESAHNFILSSTAHIIEEREYIVDHVKTQGSPKIVALTVLLH